LDFRSHDFLGIGKSSSLHAQRAQTVIRPSEMKNSIRRENVKLELKPLTSAQLRAGRALIRWSAEDLARVSAVSVTTIRRAELMEEQTSMTAPNDLAVRRALEVAGVEFIDENGGGPGVRLRKPLNRSRK
jgi:hypothetical protein